MKTQYQYIHFEKWTSEPGNLTWKCYNTRSNDELGEVRWYPAWRQYCYFPSCPANYSAECLNNIANFIEQLLKA